MCFLKDTKLLTEGQAELTKKKNIYNNETEDGNASNTLIIDPNPTITDGCHF